MRLLPLAAALALLAACPAGGPGPRVARPAGVAPRSNLVAGDYAGSEVCASCHPAIYEAWRRSPMHNMTRVPETAAIRAPFDGAEWRFKDDGARFVRAGDARFVRLRSRDFGDHVYRVTRVIGGRYREDFAGVEVRDAAPGAPVIGDPGAELILPVSYVFETRSFRLKGYSVMVGERPGLRAGGVWNQTCVLCHNTYPLLGSLLGELHGAGAPSYQGEVVDRALPPDRRVGLRVTDAAALTAAVSDEARRLGAPAADAGDVRGALANGARAMHDRLGAGHFVELGIGCEACHGGSREHVRRNEVHPSFEPRSPFLQATPPPGQPEVTRAEWINRACARCHQVLFSRYPWTWEGGQRRRAPGGSHITSGEARDFLLGGCARRMACTACHDPHGEDDRARLAALATPAGNRTCTGCHPAYAAPEALRAHAHHDPTGAGGACVACHMPRKNMGLGYELTRYHRIGSPTDRARVEGDRPLECALCHARSTVGELAGAMERWWGKRYDRARLVELYGDLSAPVLRATVARGKPHEVATAVSALGEARVTEAIPGVRAQLAHAMPLVRLYARRALERLDGHPVAIDVEQDAEDVRTALAHAADPAAPARPAAPRPARPRAADGASDED